MHLIDTHCHVGFRAYAQDAEEVIRRAEAEGIIMVTIGTQRDTSRAAAELANAHDCMYASIGLHPTHTIAHGFNDTQELDFKPRQEAFEEAVYEEILRSSKKIVGVGECGLDYYRLPAESAAEMKRTQWAAAMAQFAFAAKHVLPVIVHCRDAHADMLSLIKESAAAYPDNRRGVIHCFTGTYEEAKKYIDEGWYISFSGIAAFAKDVGEVAAKLPLDSVVIETDAPYLTPPPHRGKRNEPLYVKFVAESIARRRGIALEELAAQTTKNAIALFNLPIKP